MVVPLSLLGVLAGWLLVLVLGSAFGYALVVGWQRWGRAIQVPQPVQPVAVRLLGPPHPPSPAISGSRPSAAADAEANGPVEERIEDDGEEFEEPEVQFLAEPQDSEADGEAPEPDNVQETAADQAERRAPPVYTLSRADAIEELSLLFDARYEEAKVLVESGLWGMENHEEWARAMRGKAAPENIDEALFSRVVSAHRQNYEKPLAQLREKQASLKQLQTLWGVGPDEAEALYEAGFSDLETIRTASTDKLAKIPGIGHALAFQMRAAAHGLAPAP